jgi:hypothetical protein
MGLLKMPSPVLGSSWAGPWVAIWILLHFSQDPF